MSSRLDELTLRRQALRLQSERLRAEFAADQREVLDALSGVERFLTKARRVAPAVLAVGAGLVLFGTLRRRRSARVAGASAMTAAATGRPGLVPRALFWIGIARQVLPYVPLIRELWLSRSSSRSRPAVLLDQ